MLWFQAAQKSFIYFSCRLVSDVEIFIELEPGEVLQIVSCFWTAQMLWFLPNRKKIYPTKPTLRIKYRAHYDMIEKYGCGHLKAHRSLQRGQIRLDLDWKLVAISPMHYNNNKKKKLHATRRKSYGSMS